MEEQVVAFSNVTKRYGDVLAVDGMSFSIKRGELLGFLGPNGSGKTTAVRLLNGVIFPDQGSIRVNGRDTVSQGNDIRRVSGVLTETAALYEHMTLEANLMFFGRVYSVAEKRLPARISELLSRFGLEEKRKSKTGTLSTGLKKRLSIAKALIHEPELLFLDEPTAGLDPEAARDIIEYIKKLNREKVTIFVCTHNLSEAEKFCSRFIFLDRGRIMEAGTLAEIEAKYSADVELRIEFDGVWEGPLPGSHPWRLDAPGVMTVHLPGRKAVPATVRFLSHHVDLFSVTATNSNLETLYFEIRRTHRERSDH